MNCLAGEEALPQFFDKYARAWDFFKRLRDATKMKIVSTDILKRDDAKPAAA